MPNDGANPHTGTVGELMKLEEVRVETLCVGREVMAGAVEALKRYRCSFSQSCLDLVSCSLKRLRLMYEGLIHMRRPRMRCISSRMCKLREFEEPGVICVGEY